MSGPDPMAASAGEPSAVLAEQALLGAFLLDNAELDAVAVWLRPADFVRPVHQALFQMMLDMRAEGMPVDPVLLLNRMTRAGMLAVDGPARAGYVHTLVAAVPVTANAAYYGRVVLEQALNRDLMAVGIRVHQIGERAVGDMTDSLSAARAQLASVADGEQRWAVASRNGRGTDEDRNGRESDPGRNGRVSDPGRDGRDNAPAPAGLFRRDAVPVVLRAVPDELAADAGIG